MQHSTRRANGSNAIFQTEAVEGGYLEMIAHSKERCLGGEHPVVVRIADPARIIRGCGGAVIRKRSCGSATIEESLQLRSFSGKNDLGGTQPLEFGPKRGFGLEFCGGEIAGSKIHERQAVGVTDHT